MRQLRTKLALWVAPWLKPKPYPMFNTTYAATTSTPQVYWTFGGNTNMPDEKGK